jgi:predicted TPR repeat methyltransferase
MSSYNAFAQFYDRLTENVDYKVRSEYISNFFSKYGNGGKKVLDLACGTGTISKYLSDMYYDVTGIDLSNDMLTIAQDKCCGKVQFLHGDITDFSLPCLYDYCICLLDSLNHLTSHNDWIRCFECVYNSLNKDGLFIFDVNTPYKHRSILCDNTFVFDEDDFFLSWDNEYIGDCDRVRILLDIFVFNGKNYDRFSEEFEEIAFDISDIKKCLSNWFDVIGIYDELTTDSPKEDSERLYFVCKRK